MNDEIQMTKQPIRQAGAIRHSGFGLLSSFVIRISSFLWASSFVAQRVMQTTFIVPMRARKTASAFTVNLELAPSPRPSPPATGERGRFIVPMRGLGITTLALRVGVALFGAASFEGQAAAIYREPFRPQFHFTPARNWMNDPNGLVFYDGEYHLFYQYNPFGDKWGHMSWGHAVSRDLVHWEHLPLALAEEDGVMIFSGSAVVDWSNTSGFGTGKKPPLVAIYTGHYTKKPLQNQHLAYSNDRGHTWTKYSGNPVLDIGEQDFRDPKVFWHEPTKRWVMVVSWPTHRKVRFYASSNLREWTHLSDFGPAGSTQGIWECPDLFPLHVEGGASSEDHQESSPSPREERAGRGTGRGASNKSGLLSPALSSSAGGEGEDHHLRPGGGIQMRQVDRMTKEMKWTLIVNVGSGAPAGGSGCQYFVGDFDGKQFTLDPSFPGPQPEFVPEGRLVADFGHDDYGAWKVSGDAFGEKPAHGALANQQSVDGFRGRGLVNSFLDGDKSRGTLTSPEFEVDHGYLSFLIGGGGHVGETCMNLLVDGRVVRTATGDNTERLKWKSWDVRELRGKKATLEIVDRHTGGWGHINVDQILLADSPARPASEPALWADFGPDFYAAVSWSDVPKRDSRRLWIGWMSNWTYANDVPTSPWRSAMSLPRELGLRKTADGIRLVQKPVRELKKLRGRHDSFKGGTFEEANAWLKARAIRGDTLEFVLEFDASPAGNQGVKLFKGAREETIVGVDRNRGWVYVDRTRSGNVTFHPRFSGAHTATLAAPHNRLKLHIFVDACAIEVFVNDGERVLTDLAFPSGNSRGLELFGTEKGARISALDVWSLKSGWIRFAHHLETTVPTE